MIKWDNFDPESISPTCNAINYFTAGLLRGVAYMCAFLDIPRHLNPTRKPSDVVAGFITVLSLVLAVCIWLASLFVPLILVRSITAVRSRSSGRLIGIEGRVDAAAVEKYLWGFNHGRLKTIQPHDYSDIPDNQHPPPGSAGDYAFTLVDVRLMTVTHIVTDQPPAAVLLLRKRDGLLAQFLCAYDIQRQAFRRQMVLTSSLRGLDGLSQHSGIRLSLGLSATRVPEQAPENGTPEDLERNHEAYSFGAEDVSLEKPNKWPILIFIYFFLVSLLCNPGSTNPLPDYEYRDMLAIYRLFFMLAQPLAYFLLSNVPSLRCWCNIALFKGLLCMPVTRFAYAFLGSHVTFLAIDFLGVFGGTLEAYYAAQGFLRGLEVPCMVAIAWSWFTPAQLPLVLLVLTQFGEKLCLLAHESPIRSGYQTLALCIGVAFYLLPTSVNSCLIARPNEVSWLSSNEKIFYSLRSVIGNRDNKPAQWSRQRFLVRCLLVFAVSLLTECDARINPLKPEYVDQIGILLLLLVVGLVVLRFPHALC
ncbi:uncharacterized protein FPRN_15218 [Fusarium proliferatum]|nr:uncharacterized protein FPRN_15218 [Fusarium proliferatum]